MPETNANDQLDIRCVQCSYELRGLTRPACPECGRNYKSIKAMLAECDKTGRNLTRFRLVVHYLLLGAGISNGIGIALVMGHYWLANLGNSWLNDAKAIELFQLPVIGELIRTLGIMTWIFIPSVTLFGIFAITVSRSLESGSGNSLKRSDWFSLMIILISCIVFVMAMSQGVTNWLLD